MKKNRQIIVLISSILLIVAILVDSLPYGYFTFLRLVVFISSLILAWSVFEIEMKWIFAVFILIAILYNPVIPVHLTRSIWVILNIITVVFFIGSTLIIRDD